MIKFLYYALLLLACSLPAIAQQSVVTGTIKNDNGQAAPFATISIPALKTGTTANQQGTYVLSVKSGTYLVKVSGVGYMTTEQAVVLQAQDTTRLDITLTGKSHLKEVVVSASRKQETLDEVPSSISIVGARDLAVQKSINNNLGDILANTVPGLGFSNNSTSNTGQTLRGRNVLVMIDGIPQSTPLRNGSRDIRTIDPSAIERVEVIKGATAIYGNGADGGLINYITRKAASDKRVSGQTSIGANTFLKNAQHTGGLQLGQQLTGTIQKWDYVIAGHYEQTGVYKDAKGQVLAPDYGLGETQMWNAFAKIGYNFNARNRLEVMYNYFNSKQRSDYVTRSGKYGNPDSATTGVLGQRPGVPEGTPYNHNASVHYSSQGLIGGTDLDVNAYLQDFYTIYSYGNFFENNGQSSIRSKKKGLRINLNTPFTFLPGSWDNNLVYGVDLLNDKTSQPLVDGRVWAPEMNMRNTAPYMQLKSVFFKHLVLKAGIRFENIHIEVPDYTTIKSLNATTNLYTNGGVAVKGGSLSYNATVFNAGLRYNQLPYFKPFISFSQSFSLAELGRTLRTAKDSTVARINSEPVKVNNYEAGFSSSLGPVNLEGAAYISTSKLGASYVQRNGTYEVARSPERVYGFEIAADVNLLKNLVLGASYAYVEGKRDVNDNGKYKDSIDAYLGGDRIPPPKITAYISYQPLPNWTLRLQMLHAGNRNRFKAPYSYPNGPVNAYAVFNFFTNYELNAHNSLQIGVENLFNKDYYTVASQWGAGNDTYIKGNGARLTVNYVYKF